MRKAGVNRAPAFHNFNQRDGSAVETNQRTTPLIDKE